MKNNLLELIQFQEIQTNNFFPIKKEVVTNAENFAKNLIESGEIDKMEMISQATRLKDAITTVFDTIKASIPHEKASGYGIELVPANGRKMVQYSEDPIWVELQKAVKDREALLNASLKVDAPVFDEEGIEIPKVSVKFASDSLTIKY